jgi:hypothetical protein
MTFRDRVGRATITQSMFGMSAPSVKIAEPVRDVRFVPVLERQKQRTAIYENWIFPRLETLNQRLPFGRKGPGVHVSRVDSRIAKRLRELPDVGKVDTEYECGLAVICTTILRTRSHTSGETRAPDLSSQVCTTNEFNVSVLMTFARLVGL